MLGLGRRGRDTGGQVAFSQLAFEQLHHHAVTDLRRGGIVPRAFVADERVQRFFLNNAEEYAESLNKSINELCA